MNLPYGLIDKKKILEAEALASKGASRKELRRFWQSIIGCQYLMRLDINDWKLTDATDTTYTYSRDRRIPHPVRYKVASTNLSVRLTDVATSKILYYNNFDLSVATKDLNVDRNLPDSVRAVTGIMKLAQQKATMMMPGILSGISLVTGIHEEQKDKALSVMVNDAPLTAYCNKGEEFKVYAIHQTFQVQDQVFPHVSLVGTVEKAPDYTYLFPKYDVNQGKKEILKAFQSGATLICVKTGFPIPPYLPSPLRSSLIIDRVKNSTFASDYLARILEAGCLEMIANEHLLIDVADRDIYDEIEAERSIQQKTKADATQGGIGIGGEYIVHIDLVKLDRQARVTYKSPKPEQKEGAGKNDKKEEKPSSRIKITVSDQHKVPDKIHYSVEGTLDVNVVSVATGEVIHTNIYPVKGQAEINYADKSELTKLQAETKAFRNMAQSFTSWLWRDIKYLVTPRLQVLKIEEKKKGNVESVLINGGYFSGFLPGNTLEIMEETIEEVDGKPLTREVVIGTLKIRDVLAATSVCTIKDGLSDRIEAAVNHPGIFVRLVK